MPQSFERLGSYRSRVAFQVREPGLSTGRHHPRPEGGLSREQFLLILVFLSDTKQQPTHQQLLSASVFDLFCAADTQSWLHLLKAADLHGL